MRKRAKQNVQARVELVVCRDVDTIDPRLLREPVASVRHRPTDLSRGRSDCRSGNDEYGWFQVRCGAQRDFDGLGGQRSVIVVE